MEKEPKSQTKNINERVAQAVTAVTGNMWFFWVSLAFILILRISRPPTPSQLLLNIENDLQLLLLAANAVVSAKQTGVLRRILGHIEKDTEKIEQFEQTKNPPA